MKLSNRSANIILAFIILISLCVSSIFMLTKQGYHEDELLTYNLANSSKELNTDGWNSPEDFNEYLAVSDARRFTTRWCTRYARSSRMCSTSGSRIP